MSTLLPRPSSPLLQRCSSASQSLACTAAGFHLFPGEGLGICPCWVSEGSCWPIPLFVKVSLDGSVALDFIDWSAQFGVICKFSEHALYRLWQVLVKDAKQVRSRTDPRCTHHQPPGRVGLLSTSFKAWLLTSFLPIYSSTYQDHIFLVQAFTTIVVVKANLVSFWHPFDISIWSLAPFCTGAPSWVFCLDKLVS